MPAGRQSSPRTAPVAQVRARGLPAARSTCTTPGYCATRGYEETSRDWFHSRTPRTDEDGYFVQAGRLRDHRGRLPARPFDVESGPRTSRGGAACLASPYEVAQLVKSSSCSPPATAERHSGGRSALGRDRLSPTPYPPDRVVDGCRIRPVTIRSDLAPPAGGLTAGESACRPPPGLGGAPVGLVLRGARRSGVSAMSPLTRSVLFWCRCGHRVTARACSPSSGCRIFGGAWLIAWSRLASRRLACRGRAQLCAPQTGGFAKAAGRLQSQKRAPSPAVVGATRAAHRPQSPERCC